MTAYRSPSRHSSALTAVTAATVFHMALGDGNFHPLLAIAGLGVGTLVAAIDRVTIYIGSLHSHGLAELRNAGLKLPAPESALSVSRLIRGFRVAQGATFGLLGGLFFTIAANGPDIRAYIDKQFLADNRTVADEMTKMVDAGTARTSDEWSHRVAGFR
jgi:hypothetical protein